MSVYLRKWENKSGKESAWYVQFQVYGEKVHERALDPDTKQPARSKAEAKNCEAKMRARLLVGTLRPLEAPLLKIFIEDVYLPWAEMNHAASHFQSDRWRAKVLIEHFGHLRLDQFSLLTVERFKKRYLDDKTRRGPKRSPASVNRVLQMLSKLFSLAISMKQIYPDQRPDITLLRENNHRLRYLSVEEEQKLRPILSARSPYLLDLVVVALHTGLRSGELFQLRKLDVDLMLNVVNVLETKSGKPRQVPIFGECRAILERICAEKGNDFVFPSPVTGGRLDNIKKGFAKCCALAGISGVTPHTLRHTYGTRLAAAGVDVATIKDLMGHADIKTTMRYVHAIAEHRHAAARRLAEYVEEQSGHLAKKSADDSSAINNKAVVAANDSKLSESIQLDQWPLATEFTQ